MNIPEVLETGVMSVLNIAVLAFLVLYVLFAVVVIKQVKLMSETLELELDQYIEIASYIHLTFAILVLILALIIL